MLGSSGSQELSTRGACGNLLRSKAIALGHPFDVRAPGVRAIWVLVVGGLVFCADPPAVWPHDAVKVMAAMTRTGRPIRSRRILSIFAHFRALAGGGGRIMLGRR